METIKNEPKEEAEQTKSNLENKDTKIKEGVDFVFQENPELAKIGNKEEYSEYLDTIFPESKVKDIVYHGTYFSDAFSKEDLTKRNRYFTDTLEYAKGIARKTLSPYILNKHPRLKYRLEKVKVLPAILNIKNPQFSNRIAQTMEIDNTKDGLVGKEVEDYSNKIDNVDVSQTNSYVVYEPEQIHILGSKQDIEGFKKFTEKQKENLDKKYLVEDDREIIEKEKFDYENLKEKMLSGEMDLLEIKNTLLDLDQKDPEHKLSEENLKFLEDKDILNYIENKDSKIKDGFNKFKSFTEFHVAQTIAIEKGEQTSIKYFEDALTLSEKIQEKNYDDINWQNYIKGTLMYLKGEKIPEEIINSAGENDHVLKRFNDGIIKRGFPFYKKDYHGIE